MRRMRNLWGLLAATTLATVGAGAAAPVLGAGLLVAQGGLGGQLEVKEHVVHVTMNNGIVVTQVTQVFQNKEDRQVEALYTFPVPKAASVSNFSMWINGKEMVGEVVEKQRARQIYDSYKQQRRDPGLLEQTDYRTFEMRVFPIAPRAEQRVQITYYQELDFDHDRATYVYPLASTTRRDLAASTAGKLSFTLDARSEIPIVGLESPSHAKEFALAKHDAHYSQASMEVTGGDLQKDIVVTYQAQRPRTGVDVITSRQPGEDGYLALTLTGGEDLAKVVGGGMDYVFVVDISGSMGEEDKLAVSRKSVEAFVGALDPADRFDIITFNVQANALFGQLKEPDAAAKRSATSYLESREARGGTQIKPALAAALRYAETKRPVNLVILSDGLAEQQDRVDLIDALAGRPANVRAFSIGVGNDINRALLEQIAERTGGLAAFISNADSFERQAQAFKRKLLRPAASDLKITFSTPDVYDIEPAKLGALYYGAPLRLYARYKTAGPVTAKLEGKIAGEAFSREIPLELPQADPANPEIDRMWAWHKVDRLLKEADAGRGRSPATTAEIVRLGEDYSIVTEYTSFLVLENDAEYQRWKIDRRNVQRVARDQAAQRELAARLEKLRENAAREIGPITPAPADRAAVQVNTTVAQAPGAPNPSAPAPSRGVDVPLGGGGSGGGGGGGSWGVGGGGAIDPISGSVLVGLGVAGLLATRKARKCQ